jgi:hypothetical protein
VVPVAYISQLQILFRFNSNISGKQATTTTTTSTMAAVTTMTIASSSGAMVLSWYGMAKRLLISHIPSQFLYGYTHTHFSVYLRGASVACMF